jgi:hypothetical protein
MRKYIADERTKVFEMLGNLFGWSYMVLAFGPWFDQNVAPHLLTTELMRSLHPSLDLMRASRQAAPGFVAQKVDENSIAAGPNSQWYVWGGTWERFQRIGHCLFALVVGFSGSLLARYFSGRCRASRVDKHLSPE